MSGDDLPGFHQPELITFSLPADAWEQLLAEAVRRALGDSPALRAAVDRQVTQAVRELAGESERLAEVKDEVRAFLTRYPTLWNDQVLQDKVGGTILRHLQGDLSHQSPF